METNFKNTDFFIEEIDESVKDLTVHDSSVTHSPANTDFFIENIDNNVIEIASDRGITPSTVSVVPANTDFFIVNIDDNIKKIATDLSITPSSVQKIPANTDFFIENIYFNLILICEELNIEPYEITISPANTDFFIEAIAKNVEKIMEAQTEIHVSGTFIHAVLSADSEISDYELDGNATQNGTPTPDAPVPISTVTGEQTVKVVGKNLFDGELELGIINGNTGQNQSNNNYIRDKNYIPVKEQTTYILSSPTFNGAYNVYEYKADLTYNLLGNKNTATGVFTTDAGTAFVRFRPGANIDTAPLTTKFQLELGNQSSLYEPYQGQSYIIDLDTIELAKIGTYQDRIYKDEGKWYVEKQVGKVVLNGTESYTQRSTSTAGLYRYDLTVSALAPGVAHAISDHFVISNESNFSNITTVCFATHPNETKIVFFSNETTDTTFKTWLASNPTTVYYALATPTTTEITDESLLAQLNAIYNAELKEGVVNISITATSPNLPASLKATIIAKE